MITLSDTVNIWSERKVIARLKTTGRQINRFALSPNKKMLAVAYGYISPCGNKKCKCSDDEGECGVTIWSTADWTLLFDAKIGYTMDVCFNESSTKLLTVSDNGHINIIEIK